MYLIFFLLMNGPLPAHFAFYNEHVAFLYHSLSGKVFLDFKVELEEVYKLYCQNHDDAISLLETYEKDDSIQHYVLECLKRLR